MSGALTGIRVVDLSRILAGPLCSQMLSDHGAEVIKIEPPTGDDTRALGPPFTPNGDAAYFSALNRGKQCISVDISTPAGRDILERLLAPADVLLDNFLPGTLEKWGIDYEAWLRPRFPRLIHCSITGFGEGGPLGGLPGYDAVVQAICGIMSINGDDTSGPTRVGLPIVDHLTAYTALSGILMALHERHQSGLGQHVDVTLFDTALSLLVPHAANYFASGKEPGLLGSAHPNISPYDRFRCGDGEIFLGITNKKQFDRFCAVIMRPDLACDPRYLSNALRVEHRQVLREEIEASILTWTRTALCDTLMRKGVPAGPVNSISEALSQPHVAHRRMTVERAGYHGIGIPIQLRKTPGCPGENPSSFNADVISVLKAAGYSEADIEQHHADRVIPKKDTRIS